MRSWTTSCQPSRSTLPVADGPVNDAPFRLIDDVAFGEDVVVHAFANLYGCTIGDGTRIGPYVEVQRGAAIGARRKIQSHTFVCDGVTIEDEVLVGQGVMFVNDKHSAQRTRPASCRQMRTGTSCRRTSREAGASASALLSSAAFGSARTR
jgi:UDP-2-acetamido-3-amino-2,3-dideoxy-glucuronate N-acetyltransferase